MPSKHEHGDKQVTEQVAPPPLSNGTDPNPFAPENFRIDQDFVSTGATKKEVTEIAVGKPSKSEFIRVHPDPAYRLNAAVIEDGSRDRVYLVVPALANGPLSKW